MPRIHLFSFLQRLSIVAPTIEFERDTCEGLLFELIHAYHQGKVSALNFYLAVVGTYPNLSEIESLELILRKIDIHEKVLEFINLEIKKSPSPTNLILFHKPSKSAIMDVTLSISLGFTSGIQRVVREVFKVNFSNLVLGRWSPDGNFFHFVESDDEARYIEGLPVKEHRSKENFYNVYLPGSRVYLFENLGWNTSILERYSALSNCLEVSSLVYDTIPLNQPYFTDAKTRNGFPLYLKSVLSFSKKIYGISNAQINQILGWAEFFGIQSRPLFELFPLGTSCNCDSPIGKDFVEENARKILIIGTFDLRKNPLAIFSCLNSIPSNVKLSITFIGPGGLFENELYAIINSWKKSSLRHIDFQVMKNVSDEILHQELSSADFSLFLSFAEGFGLPVIECLAHATPVIISAEPSVVESAGQSGVVVVPVTDERLLKEVFYRFCTDGEFLSGLIDECVSKKSKISDWPLLK